MKDVSNSEVDKTAKGFGVTYKSTVQSRNDRVKGHGDMKMHGTKAAFDKQHNDTAKA